MNNRERTHRFDLDISRIKNFPEIAWFFVRGFRWGRKTFFSKPRSKTPAVFVKMGVGEAQELLGNHFFEPGWETSYEYHGEDLNMRRAECVNGEESNIRWWQVHIRGYCHEQDDAGTCTKLELAGHFEPEPLEHPKKHASGEFIDIPRGNEVLVELLEENSVPYTKIRDWA